MIDKPNYDEYFKGIAKQLHVVYQQCYPPIREFGELRRYAKEPSQSANCLEHAVFNFSDEMLMWLLEKYGEDIYKFWSNFPGAASVLDKKPEEQLRDVTPQIVERIQSTGLKVEECGIDDEVEEGQWKVAYYFNLCDEKGQFMPDFHFFRQEQDGRWSSKLGKMPHVQFYRKLPEIFAGGYKIQKVFKITNPYMYKSNEGENE